jgi:hypothetical protein
MQATLMVFLCIAVFSSLEMHPAFAFRCEDKLVSQGDTKFEVLSKCGEPAWIEKRTVKKIESHDDDGSSAQRHHRDHRTLVVPVEVEEWTYNLGPGRLIQILTFENGKLMKVENGGYGY